MLGGGARGAAAVTALRAAVCSILQFLKIETRLQLEIRESGAETSNREIAGHLQVNSGTRAPARRRQITGLDYFLRKKNVLNW